MSTTAALFVTGCEKSGKTPLRLILDAQPWACLSRGRLWGRHYGRHGDLTGPAALDACVAAVAAEDPELDVAGIRADLETGPAPLRSYAGIFGAAARQRAERVGAPIWGDQASEIEDHADEVMAAFPGARIVHLVRDPRDRYTESRQRGRRGGLGQAAATWGHSTARARENSDRFPETYRVVRYEDLVASPDEVVAAIASDLGQTPTPVDAAMVPDAASVGRFERSLDGVAVAYLEDRAGEGMQRWRYQPAPEPLSRSERWRLRLWVGPVNDVRARLMRGST